VTEIRHHHGARIDQRVAHGLRLISVVRIDPDCSHAKRRVLGRNPGKASEDLTKIDGQLLFRIAFRHGQRDPRLENAVADRCQSSLSRMRAARMQNQGLCAGFLRTPPIRPIDGPSGVSAGEWNYLDADPEPIVSGGREAASPNIFLWVRVVSVL